MSSEEEKNKALARRFLEAREKGDLAVVDEMMAPDYVTHANCFLAKSPAAKAQYGRSPNSLPPSPTPA